MKSLQRLKFKGKLVLGLTSLGVTLGSLASLTSENIVQTTTKKESFKATLLNSNLQDLEMSYEVCEFVDKQKEETENKKEPNLVPLENCRKKEVKIPKKRHKTDAEMKEELDDLWERVKKLSVSVEDSKKRYRELWGIREDSSITYKKSRLG